MRGTSNGNTSGSSYARRRRKRWLVDTFGDGEKVRCHLRVSPRCVEWLTVETVTADRIIPGCQGGTYRRDNIQPACLSCNSVHGGAIRRGKDNASQQ